MAFVELQNLVLKGRSCWQEASVRNGRKTVRRVLFRKRALSALQTQWVRFRTQIAGWNEFTELSRRNSVKNKKSLSLVFGTVLSERVFGPSPDLASPKKFWKNVWVFWCPALKVSQIQADQSPIIGTEFREGDVTVTKQMSVKRIAFALNQGEAFSEWRHLCRVPQESPFSEGLQAIQCIAGLSKLNLSVLIPFPQSQLLDLSLIALGANSWRLIAISQSLPFF